MKFTIQALTLLTFVVIGTVTVFSQTASDLGLSARGRLSEGKAIHSKGQVVWSGKLLMEFENKGSKPIILIDPRLALGTGLSKLEFFFGERNERSSEVKARLGFTKSLAATTSQSENLRSLANLFDSERPPDNLTVILEPGSAITFEDDLEINQKYSPIKDDGKEGGVSWEGGAGWFKDAVGSYVRQIGLPVGDAGYVQATYEFAITSVTESPDLLDKLRRRWKKYGELPMNQSGVYQIITEPIRTYKGFEKIDWPTRSGGLIPVTVEYYPLTY